MTFREAVERETLGGFDDRLRRFVADTPLLHALAQLGLHPRHALRAAMEAHGPAQFLGFLSAKVGHDHGDLEHLLLEERHAQGALQDRAQVLVEVHRLLLARAARKVRVNQIALDRAGPDDRHLNRHVVEAPGLHPGQGRHLGAAFDLKYADGVGPAHGVESFLVILWDGGEVHGLPTLPAEFDGVLEHGHHAQAEQVPP